MYISKQDQEKRYPSQKVNPTSSVNRVLIHSKVLLNLPRQLIRLYHTLTLQRRKLQGKNKQIRKTV